MIGFSRVAKSCLAVAALAVALVPHLAIAQRERIRISEDWRFLKEDPAGLTADLRYDVRPSVEKSADGRVADAPPEAAAAIATADAQVLKPWILPSGNGFIARSRETPCPSGRQIPVATFPSSRSGFDDSRWQKVTLPHDWAIARTVSGRPALMAVWADCRAGASAGTARSWTFPASRQGQDRCSSMSTAPCPIRAVWLNGKLVGGWPYGYNGWRLDLTPYLVVRRQEPARDPSRQPAGIGALVSWRRALSRCLADQDQPASMSANGAPLSPRREVSKAAATIALDVTVDNDVEGRCAISSIATAIYALADGRRVGAVVARIAPATRA
jgi:beta-galactosidase